MKNKNVNLKLQLKKETIANLNNDKSKGFNAMASETCVTNCQTTCQNTCPATCQVSCGGGCETVTACVTVCVNTTASPQCKTC
jgi:hypothetical protein